MKSIPYACVIVFVLAFVVSSADAALIGAWRQDEASGNLIDSTGGHPAGVPTGTPSYGQAGVANGTYGAINVTNAAGNSIEYGPSDVDEFFTVGTDNNNPVMNLDRAGAFTVMGWVNPAAPAAAGRPYRFLSTGRAAGAARGWGFGLRLNNTNGTGSAIRFTNYGVADNDSSAFDVTFGNWVHIAATYNNGQINYFLNGNALDADTSLFGNDGAPARLVIGGRLGGNDTDQMNGRVDGVQVYNEVLTADQIRQAAAASVSVPEPSAVFMLGVASCLALVRRQRA
jgi:hypothetical protein